MIIFSTSDMVLNHLYTAVVPDDDLGRISEEEEQQPLRSQTPPTPPDRDPHQHSPHRMRNTFSGAPGDRRPGAGRATGRRWMPNVVRQLVGIGMVP